ncbi:SH3-like domain-containing protein [Mesorhizobium albiziae]|uniref:SH3-like domain-containing protein n=1 Tax=Neomesorhizobium albiziae TaxID=335020 RepID=A0A1I3WJ90_9HYPH|nr:SH3 domain-containing protein [Mesorhizobium albiziae]SFK06526.1 SH3-like domain-containing protein [Mesorhizobium albiziae]
MSGFVSLCRTVSAALLALAVVSTGTLTSSVAAAPASPDVTRGPSGLPLPRFVSLKSAKVNSRIGPGVNYAVDWMYMKPGLPMEIIQEYDNWRRVRDSDGAEGWINQSLLSGRRTGIVAPWQKGKKAQIGLMAEPGNSGGTVATIEPGVVGTIKVCNGDWCEMTFSGHTGWINQSLVWGVYPGETIKD